jgi:hypothetical protein
MTHAESDNPIAKLTQDFASPPHQYRPIAWWMLNGDLKPETMRWQLEKFAAYGFSGYATYPYRGLLVPYHSEEWWRAVASMLESSSELGLDAWLLDEFNWPSGHCAGYVLRDQPWLRNVVLRRYEGAAEPGGDIALAIDGEVLAVIFEIAGEISPIADWMLETLPEETRVHWHNRTGKTGRLHVITRAPRRVTYYFAHGAPWALGSDQAWGHLDLLNPDGIRAALRYTQEQYAARFPEMLGTTIKGFFTDENVLSGGGLPYTQGIEDEFARRYGYDLRPHLHELFINRGDYLKLRYDYWRIAADWIGAHYYQPYRDWCDRHGVCLIGHLCGEESIGSNVTLNADVFEAGRRLTYPGVDMLYGVTPYDSRDKWNQPGNHCADTDPRAFHLTMKLAQSTAKHAGAKRMFNEAFCCEDYAASPQNLKRSCNYYAALGVSHLLVADFNYSHAGIRKRRGGSKCFGTPWNRFYRQITDYIARLSVFAAAGSPPADIGILYPRATAWTGPDGEILGKLDGLLYSLLDALMRSHWQFDFVYEQLLEQAQVADGRLRVPAEAYRVLIAPGCKVLTEATLSKLEQFVDAGGVLLVMPPFGEESPDCAAVVERAATLLKADTCAAWPLPEGDTAAARQLCDRTLGQWLHKPLSLDGDGAAEMVVSRRKVGGTDLFLLANMGGRQIEVKVSGAAHNKQWALWNLENGGQAPLACPTILSFAPGEAALLCAEETAACSPKEGRPPRRAREPESLTTISGPWRFSLEGKNQFRLDPRIRYDEMDIGLDQKWERSCDTEAWEPLERHAAPRELDAKFLPAYWLRATFDVEHLPEDLELAVDSDLVTHVFVNQRQVTDSSPVLLWHGENRAYPVRDLVRPGANEVTLRCRTEKLNLERICNMPATPIVLTGSFSVEGTTVAAPREKMAAGPWHENGYPHLAGTAIYETEFPWQGEARGIVCLELGKVGDVAEVKLNGTPIGCRLWQPYRFDITHALREGDNALTIAVTSGIGNLLPYGYTDQLVPGPVPYGLLEAPRLIEERA